MKYQSNSLIKCRTENKKSFKKSRRLKSKRKNNSRNKLDWDARARVRKKIILISAKDASQSTHYRPLNV